MRQRLWQRLTQVTMSSSWKELFGFQWECTHSVHMRMWQWLSMRMFTQCSHENVGVAFNENVYTVFTWECRSGFQWECLHSVHMRMSEWLSMRMFTQCSHQNVHIVFTWECWSGFQWECLHSVHMRMSEWLSMRMFTQCSHEVGVAFNENVYTVFTWEQWLSRMFTQNVHIVFTWECWSGFQWECLHSVRIWHHRMLEWLSMRMFTQCSHQNVDIVSSHENVTVAFNENVHTRMFT